MADTPEYLRQIEDKILELEPTNVESIKLLKEEHERVRAALKAAQPKAVQAAGASGAPTGGGDGELPSLRTTAAVTATAPARALAGLGDLAYEGMNWVSKKLGNEGEQTPNLSSRVERLTDELAGKPVGESIGRSAYEGAVTGPTSGFRKGAALLAEALAGGAAGGASEAVKQGGGHPAAQIVAALLAGKTAGTLSKNATLSPSEIIAKGRLNEATEGLSGDDFRTAREAQTQARREGVNLLPSQSMQVHAPGLEKLQGALMGSKADKADAFRNAATQQPKDVAMLVESLRKMGGQTPRPDDMMADSIQQITESVAARAPKAINEATRPLYNDPLAKNWKVSPEVAERVQLGLDQAIHEHRGTAATVAALKEAKRDLDNALSVGETTPGLIADTIESVKRNLVAYSEYPNAANNTRKVVAQTIKPLEDLVAKHSPARAQAPKMQAELRADLPSDFNEVIKQARTSTGTKGALAAVEEHPELLRVIAQENPTLAREILQRQLDNAVRKATAMDKKGLPPTTQGITLAAALTEKGTALSAAAFEKNLDLLFPGRPQAVEGFKRVLEVAKNASKPTGKGGREGDFSAAYEGTKGAIGSPAQRAGVAARISQWAFGNLRDNASLEVLSRPDVLERLEKLANMPKPRLTAAAVLASVPQLFEEPQQ